MEVSTSLTKSSKNREHRHLLRVCLACPTHIQCETTCKDQHHLTQSAWLLLHLRRHHHRCHQHRQWICQLLAISHRTTLIEANYQFHRLLHLYHLRTMLIEILNQIILYLHQLRLLHRHHLLRHRRQFQAPFQLLHHYHQAWQMEELHLLLRHQCRQEASRQLPIPLWI